MRVGRFLGIVVVVGICVPANGHAADDGDVLRLNGGEWRLHGVEVPAPGQVCGDGWRVGEAAQAAIARLTDGARVDCRNTAKDQYSRPVATCLVDGRDLGATLVRQGMAWASLRHTWRYLFDDLAAWFHGDGLHAHACDKPHEWRARHGDR